MIEQERIEREIKNLIRERRDLVGHIQKKHPYFHSIDGFIVPNVLSDKIEELIERLDNLQSKT